MKMNLTGAIETLKLHKHTTDKFKHSVGDQYVSDAIGTVVSELENRDKSSQVSHDSNVTSKTYTSADIQAFFSWATDNGWYYGELTELWHNDEEDLEGLIIDDVLKIWEETK